jgi:hypothetical protein
LRASEMLAGQFGRALLEVHLPKHIHTLYVNSD